MEWLINGRKALNLFMVITLPMGLVAMEVRKVADETIAVVPSPNNGSSPLWCYGSSIFVRDEDTLYLSLLQVDEEYQPSCNCHWEIWKRSEGKWQTLFLGGRGLEREPCPLVLMAPGELVLSTQSKVMEKPFHDRKGDVPWYARPGLLGIFPDKTDNDDAYHHYHPVFPDGAQFSDTSYRGIGVDPANREVLLLLIDQPEDNYLPSWLKHDGTWEKLPTLQFPIRACYPQIVLNNRQAHVLAIGDIYEPNETWRAYKYEKLQRKWYYAFRRLFYAWSPDLEEDGFRRPIEVDTVDETAGYMLNLDLHLDDRGRAHVLYLKKPQQYDFMRDQFFLGAKMTVSLEYAVLEEGKVVQRATLLTGSAEELFPGGKDLLHLWSGRFHPLTNGTLSVLYSGSWTNEQDEEARGMFLAKLSERGHLIERIQLPVEKVLTGIYFTNTPRCDSDVDNHLDIIGALFDGESYEMRYLGFEIQ